MSRRLTGQLFLGVLLLCVIAASGCRWFRSSDPLDWEIEGHTAIRLQEWLRETEPELPAEVQREFVWAFNTIARTTPNWKAVDPSSHQNPLCLRLRKKTIRNLIIEAYQFTADSYYSRISNDNDTVLRYVQLNTDIDRTLDEENRYQNYLVSLNRRIAESRRELDKCEKRIAELRASRSP